VVLAEDGPLSGLLGAAGVESRVLPLAVLRRGAMSPRGVASLGRALWRDRRELGRVVREERVALVHANTSVVLAGRRLGVPHLTHVREIYEGVAPAALWPLQRRRLARSDALACVSQAVADQFERRAFVLHDGLARTPRPPAREEARRELGLPGDRFVVALLGRVSDWKGQDVLARALAQPALADIGALGLVAGDAYPGQERFEDELAALRDELGLGDRLRLLGFREDVDTLLGAADAVVVPSKRPDPLPNTAIEAGAAGLPVVGSASGGLPEIVVDGETGLLVAPGDAAALASALRRLADDPERAATMGQRAAALIPERFSLPRMLRSLEEKYEDLALR
jgi:glycosyltransferase involved in cell wall biosynthesis